MPRLLGPSYHLQALTEHAAGLVVVGRVGVRVVDREPRDGQRVADTLTLAQVGTQVHSLRLPSFTVSTEAAFALPDERLSIRHDAGSSAEPYVAGTLLAVRAVPTVQGLVRGLDTLLLR